MALKILMNGSKGRMGQTILAIAKEFDAEVVAEVDVGDNPAEFIGKCEVVIDFSFHSVTLPLVQLAAQHGKPLVIGTTGHSEEEKAAVADAGTALPIVWAGNYSVGVNVLFYMLGKAATVLGKDYNPEVVEMHHRLKVDAPSGTAVRMVEVIREARNLTPEQEKHGRHGVIGERPEDEIGVHALRGGDIVGEHTAFFVGDGERIELTHRATDRRIFAQGAIRAAHWILKQPAGLYNMEDVLGLKD